MAPLEETFKPCCSRGFLLIDTGCETTILHFLIGALNVEPLTLYVDRDMQLQEEEDESACTGPQLLICLGCFKPAEFLINHPPGTERLFPEEED